MKHLFYMLYSPSTKRTYTGYTKGENPFLRLRKHNGEITGGAKQTKRGRPWILVLYIEGFPNNIEALRFEWRTHHPHSYISKEKKKSVVRGWGFDGRIESICSILCMEKVCSKACILQSLPLQINWMMEIDPPSILVNTAEKYSIPLIKHK